MSIRGREVKGRADVNYYTIRGLGDTAEFSNQLVRAFDDGVEKNGQLAKDDGLIVMQASAALVRDNCSRCNLYANNEKEGSYYLYYLLRTFEQRGHIDFRDMPQMFQSGCRKKEGYLTQLNRNLGGVIMSLSRRNRFLEDRNAVTSQFRELSVILEESSHQIDRARDITDEYEYILKKYFRRYHVVLGNLLSLEHENGQKEAFSTTRATNGRCTTSKNAALTIGEAMDGTRWGPTKDNRSITIKQYEVVRSLEEGGYCMPHEAPRIPKRGEKYSGDNYVFCEGPGNQVAMSLSDGVGSGEAATKENKQVVELTGQLLETGFSPRVALKLANAVLLLAGPEQYPATLGLSYIDLHTGALEAMKLGAAPTSMVGEEGVEIMEAGEVPMGILNGAEPVLMSRKLQEGDQTVMVSGEALDILPGNDKEQIMQQYLKGVEKMGPQELTDQIPDFAVSFTLAPRDDMTILAAGIWRRCPQFIMTGL